MEYLKSAKSAWIWTVIRVWLGVQWVIHAWPKHTAAQPWDACGFLKGAAAKIIPAANLTPEQLKAFKPITATWWGEFLNSFAIPNVKVFNLMVPWGATPTSW